MISRYFYVFVFLGFTATAIPVSAANHSLDAEARILGDKFHAVGAIIQVHNQDMNYKGAKNGPICTGTLIQEPGNTSGRSRLVVTAAHCIPSDQDAPFIKLYFQLGTTGATDCNRNAYLVQGWQKHARYTGVEVENYLPDYNKKLANDIAYLILDTVPDVAPVRVWSGSASDSFSSPLFFSVSYSVPGHHVANPFMPPDSFKRAVNVKNLDFDPQYISLSARLAETETESPLSRSDAGSPLIIESDSQYYLFGIASLMYPEATPTMKAFVHSSSEIIKEVGDVAVSLSGQQLVLADELKDTWRAIYHNYRSQPGIKNDVIKWRSACVSDDSDFWRNRLPVITVHSIRVGDWMQTRMWSRLDGSLYPGNTVLSDASCSLPGCLRLHNVQVRHAAKVDGDRPIIIDGLSITKKDAKVEIAATSSLTALQGTNVNGILSVEGTLITPMLSVSASGEIRGAGRIEGTQYTSMRVTNDGKIVSTGLQFEGEFVQSSTGFLEILMNDLNAAALTVAKTARLAGRLQVQLPDASMDSGDTQSELSPVTVMYAGDEIQGQFETVTCLQSSGAIECRPSMLYLNPGYELQILYGNLLK